MPGRFEYLPDIDPMNWDGDYDDPEIGPWFIGHDPLGPFDTLRAALFSIPPYDRETWVIMAMSLKSELGEAGFDLWESWSRQATHPKHGYRPADARTVWKSVRRTGPSGRTVTIGTLYATAKEHGWTGEAPVIPQMTPEERRRRQEQARREAEARERAARRAADMASKMLQQAELGPHDYLSRKGFTDAQGLVLDGKLLVPMRSVASVALQSIQTIAEDGSKKFLPGGKAKGAVCNLGRHWTRWYVEGYATGLSVQAALKRMYRQDQVVVCFSAGNLAHVAPPPDPFSPRQRYVIADNDESGTGEKYALKTGLPYWMPPEPGDANDFHQAHGIEALADALREALNAHY